MERLEDFLHMLFDGPPADRQDRGDLAVAFAGGDPSQHTSLALIAYGVYLMLTSSFGIVAIVFGVIGLLFGISDLRDFLHPSTEKMGWWYSHMARMLSAYIATVTAFSVVNFKFLPPVARWLWATAIGTVGIVIWTRYYRRRFSGRGADRDVRDSGSRPNR